MNEIKYWIITASKDHVRKGKSEGFAQASHGKSSPLKRLKNGDFIIYYSSKLWFDKPGKCQEFTALGRVKDDNIYQVKLSADFQPFRRNIDFFKSRDIPIRPLIEDLEFIKDKKKWGYPFRRGYFEIGRRDFYLISSQMLDNEAYEKIT